MRCAILIVVSAQQIRIVNQAGLPIENAVKRDFVTVPMAPVMISIAAVMPSQVVIALTLVDFWHNTIFLTLVYHLFVPVIPRHNVLMGLNAGQQRMLFVISLDFVRVVSFLQVYQNIYAMTYL